MKTLVDVAREAFLLLDPQLRVISANSIFFRTFRVSKKMTVGKLLYKLGDGQWDILELRKLLSQVLPKKKVVRNFQVTHDFPTIGKKTILLNARQVDSVQLIILAMEDVSERQLLKEKLMQNIKTLESRVAERTAQLSERVEELESLNTSMVGRELTMVKLKKQTKALQKQLGLRRRAR